jgi:hypothetical protein
MEIFWDLKDNMAILQQQITNMTTYINIVNESDNILETLIYMFFFLI